MSENILLTQKIPKEWEKREKLRDKGQFWTPSWVAEAMISYVSKNTSLVFDPGTGNGSFFKALKKNHNDEKIKFYGIDIDKEILKEKIYLDPLCNVEFRDFIKNPPQKKFKSIIANPPYIRHHRIDNETKSFLKQLSKKITGTIIDGRAGYHIYFFIQALNLLEEKGRLAFIMPADTCEGAFSGNLWNWVTKNYCLECVVTFDRYATPFPAIDTNAIIFLIKKDIPKEDIIWVRVNKLDPKELYNFISSDFKQEKLKTLSITKRSLKEALDTGLSRPKQSDNNFKYHLSDFASVMRGIATGGNEFFFLTKEKAKELEIPERFLKLAIGRTKDISGKIITKNEIKELEKRGRPTFILSIDKKDEYLPKAILDYLEKGVRLGLPNRALIKQRKPWFKMEKREVPLLLFAYLGRRNFRFIKNEADIIPLTSFLCVYPKRNDKIYVNVLWEILNHPDTLKNLHLVGKSYGSGAIKVEPRSLEKLPIPEHLVEESLLKLGQVKLNTFI